MLTIYGIKNCDTVRKAFKWLDSQRIDFVFHDFYKDGLDRAVVERWVQALGWESVVNRRSTTWRKLPKTDQKNIDGPLAMTLMLRHPTLIKRPVITYNDTILQGFADQTRARLTADFLNEEN